MKGHFVYMVYYVAPGNVFPVLDPPYIIYRNPKCKELSKNIRALHGSALENRRKWYGLEFHGFSNGAVYDI